MFSTNLAKANVVVDDLSRITMVSFSHLDNAKKQLVKDIHRLSHLGVRLEDSSKVYFMVHHNSESSLVVEVRSKQHLYQPLMELKGSIIGKLSESFY